MNVKPAVWWAAALMCVCCVGGWAQSRQVVCEQGRGSFEASVPKNVTVRVGPVASGGFATRTCEAVLRRGKERTVVVPTAAQVDVDVLGADLGFGERVVAFVVRPAQDDWRESYEIWSLERKPHLLLKLSGEDSFRAMDAEFNQQIAIWTTDAAAVQGFDGLSHADFAFPPMVALQLEHGRLVDVSAWYPEQYDVQIAALRASLTRDALAEFRTSDGELRPGPVPPAELARLRQTKAAVLQIVWAYLYSGRAERAWAELENVWPGGDVARVKAAIVATRARGLEAQVAKVAARKLSPEWMEKPLIYEYLKPVEAEAQSSGRLMYGAPGVTGSEGPVVVREPGSPELYAADKEPRPILLWRPPLSSAEQTRAQREETVLLTIDEAGKVQSAKMQAPNSDPELLESAKNWKFIPASRDGKPVAYRLKMDVSLLR